jgi:hypothetical protein
MGLNRVIDGASDPTHLEHSAGKAVACSNGDDTDSETSGAVQLHEPCPNTGRVIMEKGERRNLHIK